jgi:hypothetical protein
MGFDFGGTHCHPDDLLQYSTKWFLIFWPGAWNESCVGIEIAAIENYRVSSDLCIIDFPTIMQIPISEFT